VLRLSRPLLVIFALGCALRLAYWWGTPYDVRAYDWDGHLEYVLLLAAQWQLPSASTGWETFQPPLYYALASLLWNAGTPWGVLVQLRLVQLFSLALSCLTLWLCLWTLHRLPWGDEQRGWTWVAALLPATLPLSVMVSTRLSNDVLIETLSVACLSLLSLYVAHEQARLRWWYAAVLCLSLGLLTKANALILIPLVVIAPLLRWSWRRWRTWEHLAAGSALTVAISGWFYWHRYVVERVPHLIGNIHNLHDDLRISGSVQTLFTFHPLELLRTPFNDPWMDESGRQHFWDFFVRSINTGEFWFGGTPLAAAALGFLLAFCASCSIGTAWLTWHRHRGPWLWSLLSIACFLGALITQRQLHAFAPQQDARLISAIILPLTILVAQLLATGSYAIRVTTCVTLGALTSATSSLLLAGSLGL
jgi:4-amino-4-deoxy-L-arabinose transferase-like glycosyltransferase